MALATAIGLAQSQRRPRHLDATSPAQRPRSTGCLASPRRSPRTPRGAHGAGPQRGHSPVLRRRATTKAQRRRVGLSLQTFRRRQGGRPCGSRREDDSQAAGRHDAAAGRAPSRCSRRSWRSINALETTRRSRRSGATEPGHGARSRDSIAPSTARAIQRAAGPRRRRRQVAAARHDERQLRQHRRRAGAVADAARGVPQRRGGHQPHGRRRSHGAWRSITPTRSRATSRSIPGITSTGAPYGTRGGMVVDHVFPADGEYVFEVTLNAGDNARYEDIDISIDGERVALLPLRDGAGGRRRWPRRQRHHDRAGRGSRRASRRSRPRSCAARKARTKI